jgi:signal peptidase I
VSVDQDPEGRSPEGSPPEPDDDLGHRLAVRAAVRAGIVLLVAALVLVLVRVLFVQSFVIPSSSMDPTLKVGDRVLVSRWDYRFGQVERGDVIVFDGAGVFSPVPAEPDSGLARVGRSIASGLGVPVGEHDYVKRVIGLPGEHVTCCDAQGRISVDGIALEEPYLPDGQVPSAISFDVIVPAGRLWVMGDNRSVSDDSRAYLGEPGNGTIPVRQVVGRVVRVWWPPSRVSGIGGDESRQVATSVTGTP